MPISQSNVSVADQGTIERPLMMGKQPFTVLREGIFPHPTLALSLNNLFTHFAS